MEAYESNANLLSNFSSPKCLSQFLKGSHFSPYAFSQNEVNLHISRQFIIHLPIHWKNNNGTQLVFSKHLSWVRHILAQETEENPILVAVG